VVTLHRTFGTTYADFPHQSTFGTQIMHQSPLRHDRHNRGLNDSLLSIPLALGALPLLLGFLWSIDRLDHTAGAPLWSICTCLFVSAWNTCSWRTDDRAVAAPGTTDDSCTAYHEYGRSRRTRRMTAKLNRHAPEGHPPAGFTEESGGLIDAGNSENAWRTRRAMSMYTRKYTSPVAARNDHSD
jgi:hypothetical protein